MIEAIVIAIAATLLTWAVLIAVARLVTLNIAAKTSRRVTTPAWPLHLAALMVGVIVLAVLL